MELKWPAITSIVYFSLYTLLLFSLSIHLYLTEENLSKKSFIKTLWSKKSIFGAILVHLYDTATDIGVIIEWWILAHDEIDYKTINMHVFVWCSISFVILYRIFMIIVALYEVSKDKYPSKLFHAFLGLIDMYIIKTVVQSIQNDETAVTPKQKTIQLTETVFESLPQVILQSVFIIRSANDPLLQANSSIILVSFSLIASLFSITNKYLWLDRSGVVAKARDSHIKPRIYCYCLSKSEEADTEISIPVCDVHKTELSKVYKCTETTTKTTTWSNSCRYALCKNCYQHFTYSYNKNQCIHLYYLLRVLWRFTFVSTKFICLSLIWVVLGGALLGIWISTSFIVWIFVYYFVAKASNMGGDPQSKQFDSESLMAAIIASVIGLK